jgi:hypothetical protein
VTVSRKSFFSLLLLIAVSFPAIARVAPDLPENSTPEVVSSVGYINPTPLTSHTTTAFDSLGSSTLVAFVSSHPSWSGRPVSIAGLSDNLGNEWKLLEGPTIWPGSSATLMSAIYYINLPLESTAHTVTVNLTNPAPLVIHVMAVSGSNTSKPPVHSSIDAVASGERATDVTAKHIEVQGQALLLGWAKNESSATASAVDGYLLDKQSTSFLWGEYKPVPSGGFYTSHFRYNSAIGYQTALVAVEPAKSPVASSQAIAARPGIPVHVVLRALSPKRTPVAYTVTEQPQHGTLSGVSPNLTYTSESDYVGTDLIEFVVTDARGKSNSASVRIIVQPKTLPERVEDNFSKIGFFSILSLSMVGVGLRLKG